MAQTRKKSRPRRKKKRRQGQGGLVAVMLVMLALLLVVLTAVYLLTGGRSQTEYPTASVTVEPLPTLAPSYLDQTCFYTQEGYITYHSDTLTARLGVDVSEYQGSIQWDAVAESGLVDYAILRAGYRGYGDGQIAQDAYLYENLEGAAANGIDVGLYFFSQATDEEEAQLEAQAVLDLIAGYDIAYPIYFDWEPVSDSSARTATISSSELTRCALAFCQTIEAAGYQAGVYFNLDMAAHYYQLYQLKDYTFWLAEYQDSPSFPYAFDMWQYTSSGSIPGIDTRVDLNLSFLP